eukprot:10644417-Alexandrium_andersonii.AAC.1
MAGGRRREAGKRHLAPPMAERSQVSKRLPPPRAGRGEVSGPTNCHTLRQQASARAAFRNA